MTVKELKEILAELPEGLTAEQFDESMVLFPFEDGFVSPCPTESGLIELGPAVDEKGNEIEEDEAAPHLCFALVPHGWHGEFEENEPLEFTPETPELN